MDTIQEFIGKHPIIFTIIVFIIFVGNVRSLYIYMSKKKNSSKQKNQCIYIFIFHRLPYFFYRLSHIIISHAFVPFISSLTTLITSSFELQFHLLLILNKYIYPISSSMINVFVHELKIFFNFVINVTEKSKTCHYNISKRITIF